MIVNSNLGFPLRLLPELVYCSRHPQRLVTVLWSRNLAGAPIKAKIFGYASTVDDLVEEWHEAPEGSEIAKRQLHEHLGMTWEEYGRWAETNELPEREDFELGRYLPDARPERLVQNDYRPEHVPTKEAVPLERRPDAPTDVAPVIPIRPGVMDVEPVLARPRSCLICLHARLSTDETWCSEFGAIRDERSAAADCPLYDENVEAR